MVILLFAAILVWSFTQYMILISNRWYALIGLLSLVVLPYYVQLSVSVMVGLPAIALGTVALLCITQWHLTKHNIWLILAGAMLALSMLIKLITGILVPLFIIGVFIDEYFSNKQRGMRWYRLPSLGLLCASFAAIIIAGIIFLIKPQNLNQLVLSHTSYYQIISTTALVALPLILLASAALLFILQWRNKKHPYWLMLAGTMFALSMTIKWFSIAWGAVFLIAILADEYLSNNKSHIKRSHYSSIILNFCAPFVIVLIVGIFLFFESGNGNKLALGGLKAFSINSTLKQIFNFIWYFNKLLLLLFLASIGSARVIKTKLVLGYYAIAWAMMGCLFICLWRPVWYHHFLLFAIPAAFLASLAFVESENTIRQSFLSRGRINLWRWIKSIKRHEWASIFVIILFITNWGIMANGLLSDAQEIKASLQQPKGDNQISNELMSQIMVYAPQTTWMITDSPMFAFKANIATPPYLAVISHKRIWSGELSKEQIGEMITQWKPELILFSGKIDANLLIRRYINTNYTQVYSEAPYKLFVINKIYE